MLPQHGKVQCRACFEHGSENATGHSKWRIVNDPGAWGSATPRYLVLGFSKGSTQADIYATGRFEQVAFAGMRPRLTAALRTMGVLSDQENVDDRIADPASDIAFGSLIRCSVARLDEAASTKKAQPVYGCTGSLITKAFAEIPTVINRCAQRFLIDLPKSVEAVFFLGNTDAYVKQCQSLLRRCFENDFREINEMGVWANGRPWIHLAHPSGLNGHFKLWIAGSGKPGAKRKQAQQAMMESALDGARG